MSDTMKELDEMFRETPPDVDEEVDLKDELDKIEDELPERFKKEL